MKNHFNTYRKNNEKKEDQTSLPESGFTVSAVNLIKILFTEIIISE